MDAEIKTKPCVGCGFCCLKSPCGASLRVYGTTTRCPALEWQETRYACKLMQLPGGIGERYREELYAGAGCCAGLNDWRLDVRQRDAALSVEASGIPPMMQTFLAALGQEWIGPDVLQLAVYHWMSLLEKDGMSKEQSGKLGKLAIHYMFEQRCQFVKDFMG